MSRRLLTAKTPHGASYPLRYLCSNPGLGTPCRVQLNRGKTNQCTLARSNWPAAALRGFSTTHHHHQQQQKDSPPDEPAADAKPEADSKAKTENPMHIYWILGIAIGVVSITTKRNWDVDKLLAKSRGEATTNTAYATPEVMITTAQKIANALGPDSVSYDPDTLDHHGHSPWSTSNSPVRAVAVVYPRSTSEGVGVV